MTEAEQAPDVKEAIRNPREERLDEPARLVEAAIFEGGARLYVLAAPVVIEIHGEVGEAYDLAALAANERGACVEEVLRLLDEADVVRVDRNEPRAEAAIRDGERIRELARGVFADVELDIHMLDEPAHDVGVDDA